MSVRYDASRIEFLAREVMRHKRAYYAGKPEISDAAYDKLEAELAKLAPEHPVLAYIGTDLTSAGSRKVTHDTPMLSLQKAYEEADLFAWKKSHDVVGTWKVDGNAIALAYEDGKLVLAKTRGNGRVGEDVTEKVRWVADCIPDLAENLTAEVRGELYCSEHNFALLVDEMLGRGLERPTSPRNIVAGLLGRKVHFDLARYFNFLAFDILFTNGRAPFRTENEKFEWLADKGFRLPYPRLLKSDDEVRAYLDEVKKNIEESEIGLDGAVFTYNDLALHDELGVTSHHPRYKISFKWQGQTAVSTIRDILWNTSRFGVVTPVAIIDPVELSGATITNITLHNAEHVKAYDLKVGDEIEIVRSGEVIPKFLEVKTPGKGHFAFPETCLSCGAALVFDDVRLRCPNRATCPAQQQGTILAWIRAVEIDDLSDKRLENMMDMGLVRSIPDLYRLTKEDLLTLPLTKEKTAAKLLANIQKSRKPPMARFLAGLGIEGTGLTSWEKLLEEFPTLEALQEATVERIVAVEGFAEKSACQVVEGLDAKKALIAELLALGVKPVREEIKVAGVKAGTLQGKHIAITGSLSRPRAELEKMIRAAGGKPASSVSKNTFVLVTNEADSGSSKAVKAKELKIPIWSEEQLISALAGEEILRSPC